MKEGQTPRLIDSAVQNLARKEEETKEAQEAIEAGKKIPQLTKKLDELIKARTKPKLGKYNGIGGNQKNTHTSFVATIRKDDIEIDVKIASNLHPDNKKNRRNSTGFIDPSSFSYTIDITHLDHFLIITREGATIFPKKPEHPAGIPLLVGGRNPISNQRGMDIKDFKQYNELLDTLIEGKDVRFSTQNHGIVFRFTPPRTRINS